MLKRALFVAFLTILPCISAAQVYQSGAVTTGNCANWAGTNLIADSGAPCNAAAGSNTQLQWNNNGTLGGISGATSNGTLVQFAPNDLSLSGSTSGSSLLNAPATGGGTATFPQGSGSLAYTLSGAKNYTIQTSGGNYTTVNGLLSFLNTQTIAPGTSINGAIGCSQTINDSSIQILSRMGAYIQLTGCAHLNNTVTSVVSSSGTSGNYAVVLQLGSSVSGITANNDYVNIHAASGGTNPSCLNGNFPVTAINNGLSQITITLPSTCLPSGSVAATLEDISSVIKVASNDVLDVWNGGSAIQLQDVQLVCGSSSGYGLSIQDVGRVFYSGDIGVYGCGDNVYEVLNSEINGQPGSVFGTGDAATENIAVTNGATFYAAGATLVVSGGAGGGVAVDLGASLNADTASVSGTGGDGFNLNRASVIYVGASGGNWASVGNAGYGFNMQTPATLKINPGGVSSGNTNGPYSVAYPLQLATDTSSMAVGINALAQSTSTSGANNTCGGSDACRYVTSATGTTAWGNNACQGVSGTPITGNNNTCIGENAGATLQGSGQANMLGGAAAGEYISTAHSTTAWGIQACQGVSGTPLTGNANTCLGANAGGVLQGAANSNTFGGGNAGAETSTGSQNAYFGYQAGQGSSGSLGTGNNNSAFGFQTLESIQGTGASNAAFGQGAAQFVSTAQGTSAFGNQACEGASGTLTTGSNNTCFGHNAGQNIQGTAAANLILGPNVAPTLHTGSSNIMLGVGSNCDVASNTTSNHFAVCAASGTPDLMDGVLTSGSLALTVNGTLSLSPLSSPGLLVNNASGAVSSVATVTTATTPANFSATTYLSVNIGGTTYYIPADTASW